MSDPKTPLGLVKEARAYADKATPGPWKWAGNDIYGMTKPCGEGGPRFQENVLDISLADRVEIRQEDKDFIARARTDIPDLCDAIESQAAEIERLRGALQGLVTRLDEVHADSRYQAVWIMFGNHGGVYTEPTYTDALARARAALRVKP